MDILYDYFLIPLMRNGWFNPVNSLVYGLGLIVGIWLVYNLLRKVKVPVDKGLFIAMIPFIAFAGVTRSLRDYVYMEASSAPGFLSSFQAYMEAMQESAYSYVLGHTGNAQLAWVESYIIAWFPTPGSYLITFALALASLGAALIVRKYWKVECYKTMAAAGTFFFVINAYMVPVRSVVPLLYVGAVTLAWAGLFFSLGAKPVIARVRNVSRKAAKGMKEFFTPINSAILSAHLFDATATFFAISMFTTSEGYGYTEQHFLSRSLMPFLGPGVMFLLKLAVVIPALYFIDRYMSGKNDRDMGRFMKLAVFILGAAPATRNLVRLVAGV